MKLLFAERLRKSYDAAPEPVRKAFDKQCALLSENLRHPSLRAKNTMSPEAGGRLASI